MSKPKRFRRKQGLAPIHPHAAAIDIGATVHVAAVGPDRDPEPVRSFGTFTADLHRLADWFAGCGVRTVGEGTPWRPPFSLPARPQTGCFVATSTIGRARRGAGRPGARAPFQLLNRLRWAVCGELGGGEKGIAGLARSRPFVYGRLEHYT